MKFLQFLNESFGTGNIIDSNKVEEKVREAIAAGVNVLEISDYVTAVDVDKNDTTFEYIEAGVKLGRMAGQSKKIFVASDEEDTEFYFFIGLNEEAIIYNLQEEIDNL